MESRSSASEHSADADHIGIRLARSGDAVAIHRMLLLVDAALSDRDWYFIDDLDFVREHIHRQGFTVLALRNSEPVGFLMVHLPGLREDNLGLDIGLPETELLRVAHMDSGAVLPQHRGRGILELMIKHAEGLLLDRGYCHFLCTVHPDNIHCMKVFVGRGYRVVATGAKHGNLERHTLLRTTDGDRTDAPE